MINVRVRVAHRRRGGPKRNGFRQTDDAGRHSFDHIFDDTTVQRRAGRVATGNNIVLRPADCHQSGYVQRNFENKSRVSIKLRSYGGLKTSDVRRPRGPGRRLEC